MADTTIEEIIKKEIIKKEIKEEIIKQEEELKLANEELVDSVITDDIQPPTDTKHDIRIDIRNFAIKLVLKYHIKTITDTEDIMIYNGGYYINGKTKLVSLFDKNFKNDATPGNLNMFFNFVRANSFIHRKDFLETENKINLKNCVVDVLTGEILDHSPNYNFLYKLDTEFNKDTKCPEIDKFLHSIVSEKDYNCLVEMIGYTLMSGGKYRTLFVLTGTGSNGKSKFMNLIEYLIGHENCSHIALNYFSDNRFASASLYGKKVNTCADIPSLTINNTGVLKQLTGEDMLMAEEKGKKAFFFKNDAKMIFSCNDLPDIKDRSTAMWGRIILIEFPNEFKNSKDDMDLLSKITAKDELSGLLNLALSGVKKLMVNKHFSYDRDTTMDRWYEFRNSKNVLNSFIKACIVLDDDKSISKKDTFTLYNSYCSCHGIIPISNMMFSMLMKKYLNYEDDYRSDYRPANEDGKQERVWQGIRISDNWINEFREKY